MMNINMKKNRLNLKKKQRTNLELDCKIDKQISYSIVSYYIFQILNLAIKTILPISTNLYSEISMIFGIMIIMFFCISILHVLKKSLIPFFLAEILWISIFTISYLMNNIYEPSILFNDIIWTIFICIPLGIYAYSIEDKEVFYNVFLKGSFIMAGVLSLMFFHNSKDSAYSMSFSYALLVPTLFHINEWLRNKKLRYLLIFVLEIGAIIVYGSRGAMLSVAFFFIIKIFLGEMSLIKKISTVLGILFVVFVFLYNFDKIGSIILENLAKKGYYSRSLSLLFAGKIDHDSGRLQLFSYYFDLIYQKPFMGWGILGGWINSGLGPHNMIIEILLAFGVILGGMISLSLLILQFRVFFVKSKSCRDLIAIYMSICVVLFMVSGNFHTNPNFFIFIGLVLSSFK